MPSPAVGIDLGTTNSVVAVSLNGKPQVIVDPASGSPLIPSVVSFPEGGERVVGRAARARKAFDPAHTVSSVKRLLGRPFKSEEVRRARSRVAFELKEGADSAVLVQTRAGQFSLPEVSAMVLREVRRVAEQSLGQRVDRCVVTVPANFNELQRSSTKIAGKIAEVEVVRILNEPTAAALAYGYGRGTREKICIYDFGGGTFDVTLLELNGNVFEVLSTWGDTFLGGDDVDLALTDMLAPHLLRATGVDATQDRLAYDILRDAAEAAKCALSQRDSAVVEFNYAPGAKGPVRFQGSLSRADLERTSAPFIEKTFAVCQESLKLAGLRPSDLTAVILVGGSTRIPGLHRRVAQFFGRDPLTHLPPEEVVGLGAAILAEALTGGARRARPTIPPGGAPMAAPPPVPPAAQATAQAPSAPPPVPSQVATLRGPTLKGNAPPPNPMRAPTPPPLPPGVARGSQAPPPIPVPGRGSQFPPPPPGAAGRPVQVPPPPSVPKATPPPRMGAGLDLDDPFAPTPPTVTAKPTPLPGALSAPPLGLGDLDQPSFVGRAPETPGAARAPAPPAPPADSPMTRTLDQPVPAFNLEDSSVVAPLPAPTPSLSLQPSAPRSPEAPGLPAMPAELPVPVAPPVIAEPPPIKPPLGAPPRPSSPAVVPVGAKPPLGAPPRPSSPAIAAVAPEAKPAAGGFSAAMAALPPSIAAAIRPPPPKAEAPAAPAAPMFPSEEEPTTAHQALGDASIPSFKLDASLFGDDATSTHEPPSAGAGARDLSVPSFRIDADDIFGGPAEAGTGTLVAKSPFESSLPSFEQPPAPPPPEPQPPADTFEQETTRAMPAVSGVGESTRAMAAPPVVPDDASLPPLVVPPPVKADVEAIRASVAPPLRPSNPAVGAAPGNDSLRPGLPPAPQRGSAPPNPFAATVSTSAMPPLAPSTPPFPAGATSSNVPPRPSMPASGIAVPLLLDVTPLSLGVETAGGLCEAVIRRNSTIPVEQTRVFATTNDNQTTVVIRIAQGESRKFSENQRLGELELAGLRAAPRGEVSIAVTFELGADGTLNVRAKDVETGREQATRVSLLTLPTEAAQAEMAARQRPPQTASA